MRPKILLAALAACASAALLAGVGPPAWAQPTGSLQVHADVLVVDSAAQRIDARGHVRISNGRTVVLAARAIYDIRARRVSLSGGVTATAPDGVLRSRQATVLLSRANTLETLDAQGAVVAKSGTRILLADRLVYGFATHEVTATGRVQLSAPTGVATGRALVADLRRRTGTLTGARIKTKQGTVSGDRLDADDALGQAVFRGHVNAEFDGTKITSETATAYEREKKVIFRGQVRIARPGRILLADVVTFYYEDNRLLAEGRTRILIQESP